MSQAQQQPQTESVQGLDSNRRTLALLAAGLLATLTPLALLSGQPFWVNILIYTYLFAGLAVTWNIKAVFGGQF